MIQKLSQTLLAQAVGFISGVSLGFVVGASTWFPVIVLTGHVLGALVVAAFLKLSRPWVYLNALLPLGIFLATLMPLSTSALAITALFLLFLFIPTLISGVPYYPTNSEVFEKVVEIIPKDEPLKFIDLGSGFGSLLLYIAKERPNVTCIGVELSPLAWIVSKVRFLFRKNCSMKFQDIFAVDLSEFDFVYAFLAPGPMPKIWKKVQKEMRPGSMFISNTFSVPATPNTTIQLKSERQRQLFLFEITTKSSPQQHP